MFQFAVSRTAKHFSLNSTDDISFVEHLKLKVLVNFGILFSCLLFLFALPLSAQTTQQQWVYIARSEEGRFYVKRKIDQLSGGNRAMWMKLVSDKGFERISYAEWDCKARRFRLLQTSSYTTDGRAIEHLKNLDWAFVTPESAAESSFEEVCGTPREVKYVLIILKESKLRGEPSINEQVYRTAKLNEKFPLTPFDPVDAWYQIYDPKTLVEYWVHGNGIKIVSGNSDFVKSSKSKKTVIREKTRKTVKSGKQ